jgi:O-antigen/teichoic acid export membrane protein
MEPGATEKPDRAPESAVAGRGDGTAPVDIGRVRGHVLLTLAGSALGALLALAAEVLAVRFLGATAYGFFALGLVLARIGGITAAFGLRLGVVHFIPRFLEKAQASEVLGTVITAVATVLAAGIGLGVLLWLTGDWAAEAIFSKPGAAPFLVYAALLIPLFALVDVLSHVPRAFNRSIEQVLTRNLLPPALFAAVLLFLILRGAAPIYAMTAQILAQALAALAGVAFVLHLLRRRVGWVSPRVSPGRLWRYSLPVVANDLLIIGVTWTGLLMLGIYASPDEVGLYRVCVQIGAAVILILHSVGLAIGPVLPVLVESDDRAQLYFVYRTALRWLMLTIIPISAVVVFNAADILALFDQSFAAGALALQLRMSGHAIGMCFGLASILLMLGGRPVLEMWNGGITFVCNILLNLFLIPRFGVDGAAGAAALSFLLVSVLRVVQARRFVGVDADFWPLVRITLISLGGGFLVTVLAGRLGLAPGSGLVALVARAAATTVLLGATLWLVEGRKFGAASLGKVMRLRKALGDSRGGGEGA